MAEKKICGDELTMNRMNFLFSLVFVASATFLSGSVLAQCLVVFDDHADGPSSATQLNLGDLRSGVIETDRDRDFFCFDVTPYAEYSVTVRPVGGFPVDEAEVALVENDGFTRLIKKSSLGGGTAAIDYINRSSARRIYIDVRSFAEYSTGGYEVSLTRTGLPMDSDGDELPDQWEMDHGFNPNSSLGINGAQGDVDGDGYSNIEEFLAITDPRDGQSRLVLSGVLPVLNARGVQWQAVPFARYRIYRSATILNPVWTLLGTMEHNLNAPIATYMDTGTQGSPEQYFYRIEMVP